MTYGNSSEAPTNNGTSSTFFGRAEGLFVMEIIECLVTWPTSPQCLRQTRTPRHGWLSIPLLGAVSMPTVSRTVIPKPYSHVQPIFTSRSHPRHRLLTVREECPSPLQAQGQIYETRRPSIPERGGSAGSRPAHCWLLFTSSQRNAGCRRA